MLGAYALQNVFVLMNALASGIPPIVGHFFQMADSTFGTWAGTAINDTSQVVAASFMHSQAAGEIATVVKLTRTLFMAPVIILLAALHARNQY